MKKLVKTLRVALGLTQQQLAAETGLSYSSIQNYEQGRKPEKSALQILVDLALKHKLNDLAGELQQWKESEAEGSTPLPVKAPDPVRRPGRYAPHNDQWHDMLEEVLEGEDVEAKQAVQTNLVVFHRDAKSIANKGQRRRAK